MALSRLMVSEEIRKAYPDLRIGVVVAEGVVNEYSDELVERTKQEFRDFVNRFGHPSDLLEHKNIQAWRDIYRSFGVNPKKKSPTAEALLTRVLKDHVPRVSAAVDCYLMAETVHCLPIGGYDLAKVQGDIILRYAAGDESFCGIGGDHEEKTVAGEVIYSDAARILTRRWNYRDCEETKIDIESERMALFVEAPLGVIESSDIMQTVEAIGRHLERYCQASTKTLLLEKGQNEIALS